VLRGTRPELVVGGSGGPTIISGTPQVILGTVAHGLPLAAAVEAPRIHEQSVPPVLGVENGVTPAVRNALALFEAPWSPRPRSAPFPRAGSMPTAHPAPPAIRARTAGRSSYVDRRVRERAEISPPRARARTTLNARSSRHLGPHRIAKFSAQGRAHVALPLEW
jgi:gamma-glutamyltranspeptidase